MGHVDPGIAKCDAATRYRKISDRASGPRAGSTKENWHLDTCSSGFAPIIHRYLCVLHT